MDSLKTNEELFNLCQTDKEKELFSYYLKEVEPCPECKTSDYGSRIVFGRPSSDLCDLAHNTGIVKLMGCSPKEERNKCRKCEKTY